MSALLRVLHLPKRHGAPRAVATVWAAAIAALLIAACGGASHNSGPTSPTTPGGGTNPSGTPNQPPVIQSIEVSTERVEVGTEVTVTATVKDAETPVERLKFEWTADGGTVTGEGAMVKWRAPSDDKTPRDYTLTLTVIERYGVPDAAGVQAENRVTGTSPAIRVHNSPKELGDLSMEFLQDFANSSVSGAACVRNFSDSCRGKLEEKSEIDLNRNLYQISDSSLKLKNVTVASSGNAADMVVACEFWSKLVKCPADQPACKLGVTEHVAGSCLLTGVYEQRRWWLCDSHFSGQLTSAMRAFFGLR